MADLETLTAKLDKLLSRTTAKSSDDDGEDVEDYGRRGIPRERLNREIEKRRAAEQALAEMGEDLAAFKQLTASKIEELKGQAAEQVGQIATRHSEDLSLLELGVKDDLGRKTLRMAYDSLPKTDRPKSVVDYFNGLREAHTAHVADPEAAPAPNVPAVLTPYLPTAAPAPQAAPRQPAPPRGPQGAPKAFDASQLPVTGDMSEFLAAIQAQERLIGGEG